jgi:hypothetical protein
LEPRLRFAWKLRIDGGAETKTRSQGGESRYTDINSEETDSKRGPSKEKRGQAYGDCRID